MYVECFLGDKVGDRLGVAAGFTTAHLTPKRVIIILWPDHQPAPFLSLYQPYFMDLLGPGTVLQTLLLSEWRGKAVKRYYYANDRTAFIKEMTS